jgi:iron donor protein CyaY
MNEQEFRKHADSALEDLKQRLLDAEGSTAGEFEVEEQGGAIHISFEEPPGRFVISPNSAAGQIWISALNTSYKLDWSSAEQEFVLPKTGENLRTLVARLMNEQLGSEVVRLE